MTTIFTILVCLQFPNQAAADVRCDVPGQGLEIFQSEPACKERADYFNKVDADMNSRGGVQQSWKCFKKSVNTWQPAS